MLLKGRLRFCTFSWCNLYAVVHYLLKPELLLQPFKIFISICHGDISYLRNICLQDLNRKHLDQINCFI